MPGLLGILESLILNFKSQFKHFKSRKIAYGDVFVSQCIVMEEGLAALRFVLRPNLINCGHQTLHHAWLVLPIHRGAFKKKFLTNHPFELKKVINTMVLPFDFFKRTFLGGESSGLFQIVLCRFVSDSYWKRYISSPDTIVFKKFGTLSTIEIMSWTCKSLRMFFRHSNCVESIAHRPIHKYDSTLVVRCAHFLKPFKPIVHCYIWQYMICVSFQQHVKHFRKRLAQFNTELDACSLLHRDFSTGFKEVLLSFSTMVT